MTITKEQQGGRRERTAEQMKVELESKLSRRQPHTRRIYENTKMDFVMIFKTLCAYLHSGLHKIRKMCIIGNIWEKIMGAVLNCVLRD